MLSIMNTCLPSPAAAVTRERVDAIRQRQQRLVDVGALPELLAPIVRRGGAFRATSDKARARTEYADTRHHQQLLGMCVCDKCWHFIYSGRYSTRVGMYKYFVHGAHQPGHIAVRSNIGVPVTFSSLYQSNLSVRTPASQTVTLSPRQVDQGKFRLPHRLAARHAALERSRHHHLQHGVGPGRHLIGPRSLGPAVSIALPQEVQHLFAGGHFLRKKRQDTQNHKKKFCACVCVCL